MSGSVGLGDGGILQVTGSDEVDSVSITRSDADLVVTLNEEPHTFAADAVVSVDVSLGAGDDAVKVGPSLGVVVDLVGGEGIDTLDANGTELGDAIVLYADRLQIGDGLVTLDTVEAFNVHGHGGGDSIRIALVPRVRPLPQWSVQVFGGDGNDIVTVAAREYEGLLDIFGEEGDDRVVHQERNAYFDGGPGNDEVHVSGRNYANDYLLQGNKISFHSNTVFSAWTGDITFAAVETASAGAFDSGDDVFALGQVSATAVRLIGGTGDDHFDTVARTNGLTVTVDAGDGNDSAVLHGWATTTLSVFEVVDGSAAYLTTNYTVNHSGLEDLTVNGIIGDDQVTIAPSASTAYTVMGDEPTEAPGDRLKLVLDGVTGTSHTATGPAAGIFTFGNRQPITYSSMETIEGADVTPPSVTGGTFQYETEQRVHLEISEVVLDTLEAADLVVVNQTTGQTIPSSEFLFSRPWTGLEGSWTYNGGTGILPDGNYTATLPAGSVMDLAGNVQSEPFTLEFHVLAGDVDRDRDVDFFDFLTLRGNYGTTNKLFSDGDVDYDSDVDFFDFLILRGNYGVTLPPPGGSGSLFDDQGSGGGLSGT